MKIKELFGITSYLSYGGGDGTYHPNKPDEFKEQTFGFKLHRHFVDNYRYSVDGKFAVQRTEQGWHTDDYLQLLKDNGIKTIWCTQGKFNEQDTIGKPSKVMPINEGDDPLDPASYHLIAEHCRQIAIRYAADTGHLLDQANVWQPGDYRDNEPKAGLGTLDAIEIQNEWNFKHEWSGASYTFTPEMYAACFKACYDAIRSVSQIEIIMGGGIGGDIQDIERFLFSLQDFYDFGKMPVDFSACFHWYMRNDSTDQSGGEYGISPERAEALEFGQNLDRLCMSWGLNGWYCTETGWSTDDSKQSAPIQEGFTQEQSQGLLMQRLVLIWGACEYCKGISFWHCRDDYDSPPYAKGGVNYKDWTPKPARDLSYEFINKFGDFDVEETSVDENNVWFSVVGNMDLLWSDGENYDVVATPKPTLITEPPPNGLKEGLIALAEKQKVLIDEFIELINTEL